MKKIMVALVVLALVVLSATAAFAVVAGSKHDLSVNGPGTIKSTSTPTTSETCVFCHTAHGSNTAMKPMWNRTAGNATFTGYGTTMANTNTATSINGSTALCLSCHDGSQAMNSLYNAPGSGNVTLGATNLGTIPVGVTNLTADMSNDHPIGVVYSVSTTAGGASLKDPSGASPTPGIVKITAVNNVRATAGTDLVQCSSCHDVHNMTAGSVMLIPLNGGNASSQLCTTCHNR